MLPLYQTWTKVPFYRYSSGSSAHSNMLHIAYHCTLEIGLCTIESCSQLTPEEITASSCIARYKTRYSKGHFTKYTFVKVTCLFNEIFGKPCNQKWASVLYHESNQDASSRFLGNQELGSQAIFTT